MRLKFTGMFRVMTIKNDEGIDMSVEEFDEI